MDGARFDRLTRSLCSRRTVLSRLLGGGLAVLGGRMVAEEVGSAQVRRRAVATPVASPVASPTAGAATPAGAACRALGGRCTSFTDCCAGDELGPTKCVDGVCQCCYPGLFTCGRFSNADLCHDPTQSLGLCCLDGSCTGPEGSCVWVGCRPGVDPDCDPDFPYPCPPGFELTFGAGDPQPLGTCPQP